MYVSIAIKLSKYLTGLLCTLYQELIKANVNSFMCDVLLHQGIMNSAILALWWHSYHTSDTLIGQTGAQVVRKKSITRNSRIFLRKTAQNLCTIKLSKISLKYSC